MVYRQHWLCPSAGQVLLRRADGEGEPAFLHEHAGAEGDETQGEAREGGAGDTRDRPGGGGRHQSWGWNWTGTQWRTGMMGNGNGVEWEWHVGITRMACSVHMCVVCSCCVQDSCHF